VAGHRAQERRRGAPDLNLGYKTFDELEQKTPSPSSSATPTEHLPDRPLHDRERRHALGHERPHGRDSARRNDINGNDRTINADDLQYACIFPLTTPVQGGDCAACIDASCNNPLCNGTQQVNARRPTPACVSSPSREGSARRVSLRRSAQRSSTILRLPTTATAR
jgi:hypothetical protein